MANARNAGQLAIDRRGFLTAALGAGLALGQGRRAAFAQEATPAVAEVPDGAVVWLKYNLNAASTEQLQAIPGAGERMTREFEEYRPYTSIAQFRGEIGKYVSPDEVAAFEEYLFVPVDPNQAGADTLQQLPGVNADVAQSLIAEGPFDSVESFLAALETALSPEQAAVAKTYVVSA